MQVREITLDPTNMDQEASFLLAELIQSSEGFLDQNKENEFVETPPDEIGSSEEMAATTSTNGVVYRLTYSLFPTVRNNHSDYFKFKYRVFNLTSEPIGVGSFSLVTACLGTVTLCLSNDERVYATYKQSNYIIKRQKIWLDEKVKLNAMNYQFQGLNLTTIARLKREIRNTKRAGIRIKKTYLRNIPDVEKIADSFTLIERFHGPELFKFYQNYLWNVDVNYDTDLLLKLTIELLRVIQKFHERGLVHQDLKPENILAYINILNGLIELKIIDLGASKKKDEKGFTCGSVEYTAPEAFERKNTDQNADVFAAGKMIAEIFGGGYEVSEDRQKAYELALNCQFKGLFRTTPDLSKTHQTEATELITQMTDRDPTRRGSISSALKILEGVQLQRKLDSLCESEHQYRSQIIFADTVAGFLREELAGIVTAKQDVITRIHALQTALESALGKIEDKPLVIQQFIDRLGIKIFEKMHAAKLAETKEALQCAVTQLCQAVMQGLNKLIRPTVLKQKYERQCGQSIKLASLIEHYERKISLAKFMRHPLTLDTLILWDRRLKQAQHIYAQIAEQAKECTLKRSSQVSVGEEGMFGNSVQVQGDTEKNSKGFEKGLDIGLKK